MPGCVPARKEARVTKEVEEESNAVGWVAATRQYFVDTRAELQKVTWPKRQEAVGGTIGVLVIVAFMTVVLGAVDGLLSIVFEWLINDGLPALVAWVERLIR